MAVTLAHPNIKIQTPSKYGLHSHQRHRDSWLHVERYYGKAQGIAAYGVMGGCHGAGRAMLDMDTKGWLSSCDNSTVITDVAPVS